MGYSQENITTMQNQMAATFAANGAIGEVDFLSVTADMNVDPTAFDAMISALNSAAHQLYA
jgi:hypothetical protein